MNETDIKTLGTGERKHFKKDAQTSGRARNMENEKY